MVEPSLTYGHGYMTDCTNTTEYFKDLAGTWDETEDGNTAALTVLYGDVFQIQVTVSAGNKIAYYSYPDEASGDPLVDIDVSRTLYPKIAFRYKTSDTSIKAKIDVIYDDPATQTVLAEASSTEWTYGTADLTGGTNIDHVRLYANQATGYVYYDFVLIHRDTFEFPFVSNTEELELVDNVLHTQIPFRVGELTHYMGANSPLIRLSGKMNYNTAWGRPYGESLMTVWKEMHADPWQWLASDLLNCKVSMPRLVLRKVGGSNASRLFAVDMKHYSLSSGSETQWNGLSWLGI